MTTLADLPAIASGPLVPTQQSPRTSPVLDVVVPVYDEETDLEPCVRRLYAYLAAAVPFSARITIADNASTDRTPEIAARLAEELDGVEVRRLDEKGRGRAIAAAWSASEAAVLAYLDVDLSTDLAALLPLVAPLVSGHSDIAIGTRLARGSRVVRGRRRETLSRGYNALLRGALGATFSDAQCGFKALRRDVARRLLPLVQDTGWFFDTELLVLAQRCGLRIHEVPVDWVDDPDSRVAIATTVLTDLRGVARVGWALTTGRIPLKEIRAQIGRTPLEPGPPGVPAGLSRQLMRFAAVGAASTLGYLVVFSLARPALGAQPANAAALLLTAVGNTAANRRVTFGIRGLRGGLRHQWQGLVVLLLALGLTAGALALLAATVAHPARWLELAVLVIANLAAALLRFLLLRHWIFRPPPATRACEPPACR